MTGRVAISSKGAAGLAVRNYGPLAISSRYGYRPRHIDADAHRIAVVNTDNGERALVADSNLLTDAARKDRDMRALWLGAFARQDHSVARLGNRVSAPQSRQYYISHVASMPRSRAGLTFATPHYVRFRFNILQVLPNVQDQNDVEAQLDNVEMAHALLDRIAPGCDMDTATRLRQVARETYESVIGAPVSMQLSEAQQLQMYQRLRALRERLNLPQIEPPTPELE